MDLDERQAHWQTAYSAKAESQVSWFQESAQPSLDLVKSVGDPGSAVIDVGGGASRLVDGLLDAGFSDLTVLDLSAAALEASQARIGAQAPQVAWILADATTWDPPRAYDVWHDRAAFHFLVAEADRAAYVARLARGLSPGGYAIIATFDRDGPEKCSGLPVVRYDSTGLGQVLGPRFRVISSLRHEHVTPAGRIQAFQFTIFCHQPGMAA